MNILLVQLLGGLFFFANEMRWLGQKKNVINFPKGRVGWVEIGGFYAIDLETIDVNLRFY